MKSIVVKFDDCVAVYHAPPLIHTDGHGNKIIMTDEEENQYMYQSLMDTVKRREFYKNVESLLTNHLRKGQMDNWINIEIKITYSDDKGCEMNIINKKNLQHFPIL